MLNRQKQQGVALITGLIFMVVLTLLAVAAMRTTGLEEKMAGNALNQDVAFQATEAAVRQGRSRVQDGLITTTSGFPAFGASCTATGLCLPSTTAVSNWTTVFPFGQKTQSTTAATYSGTALVGVANQPQYIIELLPDVSVPAGNSLAVGRFAGGGTATPFRITARGWSMAAEAQATTQATYLDF